MAKQAGQQGAHSLDEAFNNFRQSYPRETVYPIFSLLKCVALCFPIVESQDAVNAFVWIVGRHQTETVAKEQALIAKRNRSPDRLKRSVLRALRQTRDLYFEDVRQNYKDGLVDRIERWGKEVQNLPVYAKLDSPHPVILAWEYEALKELCGLVAKEAGFSGWTKYAEQVRGGESGLMPFRLWPDGTIAALVGVPENATAEQVALELLSTRTRLSIEHLRKLISEGNRFFPGELSEMLRKRFKIVCADTDPFELIQDDDFRAEVESFGANAESGFQIGRIFSNDNDLPWLTTAEQVDAFKKK